MAVNGIQQHDRGLLGSFRLLVRAMVQDTTANTSPRSRITNRMKTDSYFLLWLCMVGFFASSAAAAFIDFDNCLETNILNNPSQLQFVPKYFYVNYNPEPGPNPLNIVIYGNVTGAAQGETAPAPGSPLWNDNSTTAGKIPNIVNNNGNETYTTLFTTIDVLTFTTYNQRTIFCDNVTQGSCPLGPVFDVNMYSAPFHCLIYT